MSTKKDIFIGHLIPSEGEGIDSNYAVDFDVKSGAIPLFKKVLFRNNLINYFSSEYLLNIFYNFPLYRYQ